MASVSNDDPLEGHDGGDIVANLLGDGVRVTHGHHLHVELLEVVNHGGELGAHDSGDGEAQAGW